MAHFRSFLNPSSFLHVPVVLLLSISWLHRSLEVFNMPLTQIRKLALIIADKTADIDAKLESAGFPTPSFDPQSSSSLLQDSVAESRRSLLEATEELHALMLGPVGLLTCHSVRTLEERIHVQKNSTR